MNSSTMTRNSNPYLALGVRPFVNCCSVRTLHGGSLMLPQVREAVAAASLQFVNLDELMQAAGARIAELTGAEWGLVTCGSAAALALATAACVAGNDPVRMLRLPFTDGIPNRVVMPVGQRFAYDQALRMVGTHIVECASAAEVEAAFATGQVAMACVLGKQDAGGALPIEDIVALARPRGIPVLVDAASEHIERPSPWLARGADLVVYSGGKFLRGPQTSGLLLGTKPLVQAAWYNAAPHHAFGRPMKVSKEDVVGVLAALEHWFADRDGGAEAQRWQGDLEAIARELDGQPELRCAVVPPSGVVRVPRLEVAWGPERHPFTSDALRQVLLEGTPRIMLDDMAATTHSLRIDPFNLQPGEAQAVGRALARAFTAARGDARPAQAGGAPAIDLSGEWEVEVAFLRGSRRHRMLLRQDGEALSGRQESEQFSGPVAGRLDADGVTLRFDACYEGSTISYSLAGQPTQAGLAGVVAFGAANGTSQGELNLRQHGAGSWTARRASAPS